MTLLPETQYGVEATDLDTVEYSDNGIYELSGEELTQCMGELAEAYPDAADALYTLMYCFGDSDHIPANASSMDNQPIRDIIVDGPLSGDPEALSIIGQYFNVKREDQLQRAFERLTQVVALPELFEAIAILESPLAADMTEQQDPFALLAAKAAKRKQIALWHGLDRLDGSTADDDYNAWLSASRGIIGAELRLEEDPPTTITAESTQDELEFCNRKIEVMHHLKDALNSMINFSREYGATDPRKAETETLTGPFTLLGPAVMRKQIVNEENDVVDEEYDLAIRFADSTGKSYGGELSVLCEAFMDSPSSLTDEAIWQVALFNALAISEDVSDFKNAFTLAVFAIYSGQPIYLYLDGECTFDEVLRGSRHLQQAAHNITRYQSNDQESGGGITSLKGQPDSRHVSNIDSRTFKRRGTVENHSGRDLDDRMLCFSADRSIDCGTSKDSGSFDLRLVTELPLLEFDTYAYPEVPGFDLVGYRLVEEWSDTHILDYVVHEEDPYRQWDVNVESQEVMLLASKLDHLGMRQTADELRGANRNTLQEVFRILQSNLVYGSGRRKVAGTAKRIEDLSYFVEQEQMVGVCSVFAALGAFCAEILLPDAEIRVIGGHRLRQTSISADGHAQVMLKLSNQEAHIIELEPQGIRSKQSAESEEIPALTAAETFVITTKNMFAALSTALANKYTNSHNAASLQKALVRQAPENFGRQIYGLLLEAQDLNGSSPEAKIADIRQRMSALSESLSAWHSAPEQTRRILAARFGNWSDQEAAYFANILITMEKNFNLA